MWWKPIGRWVIVALTLMANAAGAADGANLGFMAYSPDSRYFSFEQLGIQDGSGSAYSEVFIVDLEKNTWVGKSPYRARTDEDSTSLLPARTEAMAKAKPLLAQLKIAEPADLLAFNPANEVVDNRQRVQFDRYFLSSERGSTNTAPNSLHELRYSLEIVPTAASPSKACPTDNGGIFGFALKLRSLKSGSETEIYRDQAVPESRHCPLSYDIAAVVAPMNYPKVERLVAIVGVYSFGFEGADRRYLAVPFVLK